MHCKTRMMRQVPLIPLSLLHLPGVSQSYQPQGAVHPFSLFLANQVPGYVRSLVLSVRQDRSGYLWKCTERPGTFGIHLISPSLRGRCRLRRSLQALSYNTLGWDWFGKSEIALLILHSAAVLSTLVGTRLS